MKSGSKKASKLKLTERDRAILRHCCEFSMVWLDVLQRKFFVGLSEKATESTIHRLRSCKPPMLRSNPLFGKRVYYQLTFAGCRTLGVSHRAAQTIGQSKIIRQFALQSFLFLGDDAHRTLLTREQIVKLLSFEGNQTPARYFYVSDELGQRRFGYTIVDFGNDVSRYADRIKKRLLWLSKRERIRDFVATGVFEVSLLTLSEGKRDQLNLVLKVDSNGCLNFRYSRSILRYPVRIFVIPDLKELIPDAHN